MPSSIYLRTGNGFPIYIFLVILCCGIFFGSGVILGISITLLVLTLIFAIYRFFRWNATAWRKIHFRGMVYYASVAGAEHAAAAKAGREFNILIPCLKLSHAFMGREYSNSEILHALTMMKEDPDYFPKIVQDNIRKVYPNVEEKVYNLAVSEAKNIPFGPQQVIASVIEDKYGGEAVTKYLIALMKGEIK